MDDELLHMVAVVADEAGNRNRLSLEMALRMILQGAKLSPAVQSCLVQAGTLIVGCLDNNPTGKPR